MDKNNISKADKNELNKVISFERENYAKALLEGRYKWSVPRKVMIAKHGTNKKRVVYVYSTVDRLLLGVLYHVFSEEYASEISSYCYSYKVGCNTGKAISFIHDFIPSDEYYGVKVDIHAYFNSVNSETLKNMLDELLPKECGLKVSLENLLFDNRCIYNGEIIEEYKSLIAGTPFASFLANYCLKDMDKDFEEAGILYARYSDDIIIIDKSKEVIDDFLDTIIKFIKSKGLEINPDKYTYFQPGDDITFLGLKLCENGKIDISDHSKQKLKKQIHRWCKKARKRMEIERNEYMYEARKVNNQLNNKNFKCYIKNEGTFGWCHYAFRYITTTDTLKELDLYTKERLRYLKTGKNNRANYKKVSEEEFREMGYVSLVQLYHLYKKDFDYYCEVISLL